MIFSKKIRYLPLIVFVFVFQINSSFAQNSKCNLRLNVFLLHKSDYPQDTPIKNALAKLVDLTTNDILNSQTIDGMPYFANLSEGKYNLVVSRKDYGRTAKQIYLNCRLVDEKNINSEIIFLTNEEKDKFYQMWQVDLRISGEFPSPEPPPSPKGKSNNLNDDALSVSAFETALNERATYLPQPEFPAGTEKIKEQIISDSNSNFVLSANVNIDKQGNVIDARAEDSSDSRSQSLIPYILEAAKKSKFVPVKVDGKTVALSGFINYVFYK